jgi:hypothetical protein
MILDAYAVMPTDGWVIEPADPKREWMDATPQKFAYRCLPLMMANQAGWVVRCPINLKATWDGGTQLSSLKITFGEGPQSAHGAAISNFGSGIMTFRLPWVFKTEKGYGLLVRGPSNFWIDGAHPLEGLVETDWSPATFTMNWKLLRRNTPVWFKKGDPVCHLMPYPLDLLEQFTPRQRLIDDNPQLKGDYENFNAERWRKLKDAGDTGEPVWMRDYMRGHLPDGTPVTGHRTGLKLRPFEGG